MLQWIRDTISNQKIDCKDKKKIELACEEVLVNIISYGYTDDKGKIDVEIDLSYEDRIEIVVTDQGSFFNPLLKEKNIDPKLPLDKRSEGGLGIVMIKQIMDEVHYNRKNSSNILRLIKKNY